MSIKNRCAAVLLFAAGLTFSLASMAQPRAETGWYVGGSIGQSEVQDFCDGVPGCDDTDTAWKFFGGYQINPNFSIEAGYTDLGKSRVNATGPGGTVDATVEATALEFVGVGSLPLGNQFSLFGKLGIYRAEVEQRGSAVVFGTPIPLDADDSNTDLTFGFGVKFDLTRNFAVRGEWQRYSDVGGSDIGEADVDVISVGIVFRFQ
jgi:OOP family OmpA-OmpF porin